MKEVKIFQCDFCKKTSFNKSYLKRHEKKCFHDPATRSCATCMWFSPLYSFHEFRRYPVKCFLGEVGEVMEGARIKLNTQCNKWMDNEIYLKNETSENQDEMADKLQSGEVNYFKILQIVNKEDVMKNHFQMKY